MPTIRACGWGERTITAQAWPGALASSLKRPRPVSRRASSLRRSAWPIALIRGASLLDDVVGAGDAGPLLDLTGDEGGERIGRQRDRGHAELVEPPGDLR